jgi:hypothetical protein
MFIAQIISIRGSEWNQTLGFGMMWLVCNEGISAASFCCKVAAWFRYMFCNTGLLKNLKLAKNSATTKARKNKHRFGILRIVFMYVWLNLKTIKFYLIKLTTDFY